MKIKSNTPDKTKIAVLISLDRFKIIIFSSYKFNNNIEIKRSIVQLILKQF
jgi:hypothetical protein